MNDEKKRQILLYILIGLIVTVYLFAIAFLIIVQDAEIVPIAPHEIVNRFNYNEEVAKDLANLSQLSYCNQAKIQSWDCGSPCQRYPEKLQDMKFLYNTTSDSSGFLGYSNKYDAIVIVFRGTLPWLAKNVIIDLKFWKTDYNRCDNKCQVHRGFLQAFSHLKKQLKNEFKSLQQKHKNAKIFITGHSLGGALSYFAVAEILKMNNLKKIDYFYTFGAPRIGDSLYVEWFEKIIQSYVLNVSRITNTGDPVPHLAPSLIYPFDFMHIGFEVFFKNIQNNEFVKCEKGEDINCAASEKFAVNILNHQSYFNWNWNKDVIICQ